LAQEGQEHMLIVTHIEKTGGTSFRKYLEDLFGPRLFRNYQVRPPVRRSKWLRVLRRLYRRMVGSRGLVPPGTQCIIGHYLARHYNRAFPNARHAVWLRDPVERAVSHYYHFLRDPDPRVNLYRELQGIQISLKEFVSLPQIRNLQAQKLAGMPLSSFDFVGITENFPAGLLLFSSIFGYPPPAQVPSTNLNPDRQGSRYRLDPELRQYIAELHKEDQLVYDEAQERFRHLCQLHGVPLHAEDLRQRLGA
jgi:hypothetical protein